MIGIILISHGELAAIAKGFLAEGRDGMVDVNELSRQKS